MKIVCKASEYSVEDKSSYYLIYNKLYSANVFALLFLAILEIFMPDSSTYKIPKSIIIQKRNNSPLEVVEVDKNLNISGNVDYEYVLIEKQYKNWILSYFLIISLAVILNIILVVFLVYIGFNSGFSFLLFLPIIVISAFCFIIIYKLYSEIKNAKKLKKITT